MRVVVVAAVLAVALAVLVLVPQASARHKDFRHMSKNVSSTLDDLLAKGKYDRRIRPDLGGPPTLVTVSIYIKSMSSVSETEQKYSMDTYFRQSWFDPRLRFSLPGIDEFSMSWLFLDRVWKPDTFIVNGHRSYLHRITVPNKFARVRSDGFVTYSMRLTLQASCPMHLRKFPLDSQRCPLLIGSYGYTASDMVYAWHPTGVGLEPGVELAQYDLVNISTIPEQLIRRGSEEYSMISASFSLRRNTGYYTLQVFVPCGLIVCSSWVSFWIDPDAVPARVSLAVTTVLSMTTMGFSGRAAMPRVNYATALDWFVILCFAFVFAVMLEYAAINFIDKVTVDLRRLIEERKKKKNSTASAVDEERQPSSSEQTAPALLAPRSAPATVPSTPRPGQRPRSSSMGAAVASTSPSVVKRRSLPGRGPRRRPSSVTLLGATWPCNAALLPPARPTVAPAVIVNLVGDEIEYADLEDLVEIRAVASMDCTVAVEAEAQDPDHSVAPTSSGDFALLTVPGAAGKPGTTLRRTQSLRRCLSVPYRLWEQTRFLPNEEDVSRQMQSDEEPEKFTKIDIVSRKVFPIAFGSMLFFYWIMYGYYISDYFPGEEDKVVLYDLARPRPPNNRQ